MKRYSLALTAITLLGLSSTAGAQSLDKNGKCRDSAGKFVAMESCQAAAAAPTKCRDVSTKKFVKCSAPNTEPVPSKAN